MVNEDAPLTLEQALNRVNATTAQKAVIDDYLGRLEAQLVTLMLAVEGWKSNPNPVFAEAIYVAGDNTLQSFLAQRRSIAHCRVMAQGTETRQ